MTLDRDALFIGTAWAQPATDAVLEVVSPHSEEVVARVPEGSAAQVMQWVGQGDGVAEQRRRAVAAYNAEGDRGEHARKTLLAALEKLVRELDEA